MIDINFPTEKKTYLSKNNLLEWVKNAFKISIDKVEQACTGALYCQIIDSCHPGKVKMNKVNWEATFDNEYLNNYKILQEAFQECGIKKNIEVERLCQEKFNDNLEFLQWMKKYYDNNYFSTSYDAIKRRKGAILVLILDKNIKSRENSKSNEKNNFISNNKENFNRNINSKSPLSKNNILDKITEPIKKGNFLNNILKKTMKRNFPTKR